MGKNNHHPAVRLNSLITSFLRPFFEWYLPYFWWMWFSCFNAPFLLA